MLHSRVLKEVRNEIAIVLKEIFDCSNLSLTCIYCNVLESIICDQFVNDFLST